MSNRLINTAQETMDMHAKVDLTWKKAIFTDDIMWQLNQITTQEDNWLGDTSKVETRFAVTRKIIHTLRNTTEMLSEINGFNGTGYSLYYNSHGFECGYCMYTHHFHIIEFEDDERYGSSLFELIAHDRGIHESLRFSIRWIDNEHGISVPRMDTSLESFSSGRVIENKYTAYQDQVMRMVFYAYNNAVSFLAW